GSGPNAPGSPGKPEPANKIHHAAHDTRSPGVHRPTPALSSWWPRPPSSSVRDEVRRKARLRCGLWTVDGCEWLVATRTRQLSTPQHKACLLPHVNMPAWVSCCLTKKCPRGGGVRCRGRG